MSWNPFRIVREFNRAIDYLKCIIEPKPRNMNETNKAIELLREKLRHYKRLSLKLGLNSTSYSVNIMVKNELNDILSEIEGFENSSEKIESELGRAVKAVERLRTVSRYKQNNMKELDKEQKEYVVELLTDLTCIRYTYGMPISKADEYIISKGLIKPKLEVGKWYSWSDKCVNVLWLVTEINDNEINGYGFLNSEWVSESTLYRGLRNYKEAIECLTPATDEEVKEALIAEAKKRGLVEGVEVISLFKGEKRVIGGLDCDGEDYVYYPDENDLWAFAKDGKRQQLFYKGEWATIVVETIPEYTMEEAIDRMGHEFKIKK